MANYLQGPAYNTYQTEEYRLPAQQIVQAISTRNAYWDAGASQIKSAYQNYLGLDLSLKANQDKLDTLMQGVNTNLKQVVSTDLSLADNVNTAMKIFDPITKDDDIKYDNAVTKHYKSQIAAAQSLKSVNGGKDYNDANFNDMVAPLQDFIQGNDPSKARDVYSTRKYYTPYHDVMDEVVKVEKNFKPDVSVLVKPETDANGKLTNSGRMIEQRNKSVLASQYRAYLNAHLSDKAKNQLQINGRVAYRNHTDVLAQDYLDYNNNKLETYTREIAELEGRKKAALASGQNTKAQEYEQDINRYREEVSRLSVTNTKLKIGDFKDLEKEKEAIAGQIYSSSWIDNIAKASERRDVEIKYSKDDVALFFLKMNNDNLNSNADRTLSWETTQANIASREKVAKMSADGKKKTDEAGNEVIDTVPTYAIATEENDQNLGKVEIDAMIAEGESLKISAADGLTKYLTTIGVVDPTKSKATNDAAMEEWGKNHTNDYRWKEYREQLDIGDSKIAAGKAVHEYVTNEVNTKNPDLASGKDLKADKNSYKIVVQTAQDQGKAIDTPIALSEKDMHRILNGENVGGFTQKALKNSENKVMGHVLYYNNQPVSTNFGQNKAIYNLLGTVYQKQVPYREVTSNLYNQAITKVQGLERFTQSPGTKEGESPTLEKVQNVIFGKLGATGLKPADITITHRDKFGGVYFKVDGTGEDISNDKIKTIIESSGGKYKKEFEGGSYYLPNSEVGSFIKPKTFSDPRLEAIQLQTDFRIGKAKNNDVFNTTSIKFGNRDFMFRVTNKGGLPMYEVVDEDSGAAFINFSTQQPFSTLEEASAMASALSKLKPEDLELKIRVLGNKPEYKIIK